MTATFRRALYIHGFNSSPDSKKAQTFYQCCRKSVPDVSVEIPALSHDPAVALSQLETIVEAGDAMPAIMVGSSLGGFYATWLAEKYGLRAALVNPAVSPHRYLGEEFLGWHTNMYTGEQYEVTAGHVDVLAALDVAAPREPGNYLLLVQTGDEVLDYRLAVEKYAGSRQIVQAGGSHAFENFAAVVPEILAFAGLDDRE